MEIYCVATYKNKADVHYKTLFRLINYDNKMYWQWICMEGSIRYNEIKPVVLFRPLRIFTDRKIYYYSRPLIEFEEGDFEYGCFCDSYV